MYWNGHYSDTIRRNLILIRTLIWFIWKVFTRTCFRGHFSTFKIYNMAFSDEAKMVLSQKYNSGNVMQVPWFMICNSYISQLVRNVHEDFYHCTITTSTKLWTKWSKTFTTNILYTVLVPSLRSLHRWQHCCCNTCGTTILVFYGMWNHSRRYDWVTRTSNFSFSTASERYMILCNILSEHLLHTS